MKLNVWPPSAEIAAHQLPVANTVAPLFATVGSPVAPEVLAWIVAPNDTSRNRVKSPGANTLGSTAVALPGSTTESARGTALAPAGNGVACGRGPRSRNAFCSSVSFGGVAVMST